MTPNLFAVLPCELPEALFTTLLQAPGVRIERIVSHSHQSPDGFWYDQPTNEWVLVLQGAAKVEFEDGTLEMRPGDYLNIPAHKKHRVGLDDAGRAHDLAGGALRWRREIDRATHSGFPIRRQHFLAEAR